MLDPVLLSMLVCPETHQDLVEANAAEIAILNEAISAGRMRTVAANQVSDPVDGALIRADRAVAYPIRDEIPVMLVAEGLDIREMAFGARAEAS